MADHALYAAILAGGMGFLLGPVQDLYDEVYERFALVPECAHAWLA